MEVQPAGDGFGQGRRKAAVKLRVTTNLVVLLGRNSSKSTGCAPPGFCMLGNGAREIHPTQLRNV